ncbi:MAG: hypothetical protein R3F43_25645 [bacterium]
MTALSAEEPYVQAVVLDQLAKAAFPGWRSARRGRPRRAWPMRSRGCGAPPLLLAGW